MHCQSVGTEHDYDTHGTAGMTTMTLKRRPSRAAEITRSAIALPIKFSTGKPERVLVMLQILALKRTKVSDAHYDVSMATVSYYVH